MKVILLKKVGDNPEGAEIEITDDSVLKAWKNLGVIEGGKAEGNLHSLKVDELKALAEEKELPKEEWEGLKKEDLIKYLTDK